LVHKEISLVDVYSADYPGLSYSIEGGIIKFLDLSTKYTKIYEAHEATIWECAYSELVGELVSVGSDGLVSSLHMIKRMRKKSNQILPSEIDRLTIEEGDLFVYSENHELDRKIKKKKKDLLKFPDIRISIQCCDWNTNVCSYNWLCYGGYNGLVRCTSINWLKQ